MHVSFSHARQALVRTPSIIEQARCSTMSRDTVAEAKRGAKALMDLQDEIEEDAAGAPLAASCYRHKTCTGLHCE